MGKTNVNTIASLACTLLILLTLPSCSHRNNLPQWIHGRWITSLDNETIHENWKLEKSCISGENYMHYENKFQKEFLRIFEKNHILYYEIVIEKDTLVFKCENYEEADTLTFVNNQNPFPKRINYAKPKDNKMSVWIENVKNDPNGILFTFKKVK
ncbi:DUF6265 family protein [uncultured Fluviicola sp.]|uniref:DUF6265 family protein n=1 Tax=uncultured Fluviicola sp. TaxID=463303 RepID=UPI00260155F5|nr:DUF6265 family protein [uncultured Fluviicola sp.]